MMIECLKKFGHAAPKNIDSLLHDKLPDILDLEKKKNRVKNLLQEMSKKDETKTKLFTTRAVVQVVPGGS